MTPTAPGAFLYASFPDEPMQRIEVIKDGDDLVARFPPQEGDDGADLPVRDVSGHFERAA
jgi:hypothetical protein